MNLPRWNPRLFRNLVAFWIMGLCNNYGYVIMLSAAEDIMDRQKGTVSSDNSTTCVEDIIGRNCTSKSTGAVLLADNIPTLLVQATFPFFMQRIPYGFRHGVICLLQAGAYFVVAYSTNVTMSLAGVVLASFGCGMGEITYLSLSSYYPKSMVSAWASGTGGAGLIGSFAYASMTEESMGNMSPKNALLAMLFIPFLFAAAYWIILWIPANVYGPSFHPNTWIVPKDYEKNIMLQSSPLSIEDIKEDDKDKDSRSNSSSNKESLNSLPYAPSDIPVGRVPQRKLSMKEKLRLIVPLIHLMVPLALVYMGEYLINQGLTELIFFSCHRGWHLSRKSQYRWYQVLYQLGVFLSRSSVNIIELPTWAIFLLPIMQTINMTFFLFESLYWFVPNIGIIFALIVFEGLLGGAAYVNVYNKIHKMVAPDVKEYSLSIASVGNSLGVNAAGFLAIPLYNFVCHRPMPRHGVR